MSTPLSELLETLREQHTQQTSIISSLSTLCTQLTKSYIERQERIDALVKQLQAADTGNGEAPLKKQKNSPEEATPTKKEYDREKCPFCTAGKISSCRCRMREYNCRNCYNAWHYCPQSDGAPVKCVPGDARGSHKKCPVCAAQC